MEEDEAMVAEQASLRLAAAATVPPPASASKKAKNLLSVST
jgi:hypothetical protein